MFPGEKHKLPHTLA